MRLSMKPWRKKSARICSSSRCDELSPKEMGRERRLGRMSGREWYDSEWMTKIPILLTDCWIDPFGLFEKRAVLPYEYSRERNKWSSWLAKEEVTYDEIYQFGKSWSEAVTPTDWSAYSYLGGFSSLNSFPTRRMIWISKTGWGGETGRDLATNEVKFTRSCFKIVRRWLRRFRSTKLVEMKL